MIQLKVYDTDGTQYWLDLYEDQPIKLTLSIEDITNAEARSVFSRTFRVPATGNNNRFFKHAFLIDGIDYDVTVKKTAEILVDGAEFRQGHIRLQKIYDNKDQDKIDYEIIFLGETRDFSSKIGDASICQLDIDSLTHEFNDTAITTSWNAWNGITGTATTGLVDGNVLYPLINHGNSYDENGVPELTEIAVVGPKRFTQNGHPAKTTQFKPMVRVKAIWDQIFLDSGYTYTSNFIDPPTTDPGLFTQLYVSAFGDEASPLLNVAASSNNTFSAQGNTDGSVNDFLEAEDEISDLGDNYNANTSAYYVPQQGEYSFYAEAYAFAWFEGYQQGDGVYLDVRLQLYVNGQSVYNGGYGDREVITLTRTLTLNENDIVKIYVDVDQGGAVIDQEEVGNQIFQCTAAAGFVNPMNSFDCEYKQIDFVKDVLTTFRLVMAPDPLNAKNFIIEPFVDYIQSGSVLDWSDKLDGSKDIQIEPLFFTQSDQIKFEHEKDADYLSAYHIAAYKNAYGYLEFDSNNELLKGTRTIKTKWAGTPITQIEGAPNTSQFIIPHLHVHEAGDNGTQHLPIKCKSRFLFYNGMQSVGTTSYHWHLEGVTGHFTTYPLVSYSSVWPLSSSGTILNWRNDVGYWGNVDTNGDGVIDYPAQGGSSLYDRYWGGYINSLYSSFARRLTANFVLNNIDLQNFSFDDVIFLNGTYYRPEKVIDAPIGNKSIVKVQLIKLLNYNSAQTIPDPEPLTTTYFIEACDGSFGNWATSSNDSIPLGTIMKIEGSGDTCIEVGQIMEPDQGAILDVLIDGITYTDCNGCNGIVLLNTYVLDDCSSGLPLQVAQEQYSFQQGDVVQYQLGGVGATYCGTITANGQSANPEGVISSPTAYECDDVIHCNQ